MVYSVRILKSGVIVKSLNSPVNPSSSAIIEGKPGSTLEDAYNTSGVTHL